MEDRKGSTWEGGWPMVSTWSLGYCKQREGGRVPSPLNNSRLLRPVAGGLLWNEAPAKNQLR